MLFNSYSFILIFLPSVTAIYFIFNKYLGSRWTRLFLLAASLFFMSFFNIYFTAVLVLSVIFNYAAGSITSYYYMNSKSRQKQAIFVSAIAGNILFLGYFKYSNFFLGTLNSLFSANISLLNLILPIGISFYTFMQIVWLVDIYRHGGYKYDFFTYCLYVTFFPYVISGPIAYHKEIIPQFIKKSVCKFSAVNVSRGLFIFTIGLFKKTFIADTLAIIANGGFEVASTLNFVEAWLVSLSYTMQLYFDFSGYTDMAIGAALLFNINIPINFDSPYKSFDIREFWRRWHITLSRFLRDYIYIPMGGNRKGDYITLANIMLTFLICGLWHGAAWTFVFWGFLHGFALVVHRLWLKTGIRLNKVFAWFLTFNFVNAAWVFFRARSFEDAMNMLKSMAGFNGVILPSYLANNQFFKKINVVGIGFGEWLTHLPDTGTHIYLLGIILIPFVLITKNSNLLLQKFQPNWKNSLIISFMMILCLLLLNQTNSFVYFNF